jgi:hypothetical protein
MTAQFAAFFLFLACLARGAVIQDLEKDLTYARIGDLGKDAIVLEAALGKPDLILDLRNATATNDLAASLAQRLAQPPPNASDHRLILLNATTSAAIVAAVSRPVPRQLSIGPNSTAVLPDIIVTITLDQDRKAYDAFKVGEPLGKLINSNPEKKRFDEATLAHNRSTLADADPGDETDPAQAPPVQEKKPAEEIHDLVLERAIQIHHALLVTERVPAVR